MAISKPEGAARADSAEAIVLSILAKTGLDPTHPARCEAEAAAWLAKPGIDDPTLEDLTILPFVTIDNEDSRDLDQAVYVEQATADRLDVYYALADASYYVSPGTALFQEALQRGVTYYVPGLAIPMLPRALSENLISLNPQVDRRALVFIMGIDATGEVTETRVTRARIHSNAKLSYQGVQAFYDAQNRNQSHPIAEERFAASLMNLETAGLRRIAHARARDVVDYNRVEAGVSIARNRNEQTHTTTDIAPDSFFIELRKRCDCERYNEQISLLCNMEGARLILDGSDANHDLHSIFRIHSPPVESRLADLRHSIKRLVELHKPPGYWLWSEHTPLADYLANLPAMGKNESRLRNVIERMILLSNSASFFSSEPGPHHALGVKAYARFSAPMREIAGIFTHKELLENLGLEKASNALEDSSTRQMIIEKANEAKKLQKKLDQEFQLLAIESFLQEDLKQPVEQRPLRAGTIMGMRSNKIYVSVEGFGIDLKLYVSDLEKHFDCRYDLNEVSANPHDKDPANPANAPVLRVGDPISLLTSAWDTARRKFILLPADTWKTV